MLALERSAPAVAEAHDLGPWPSIPRRTIARITAFRPGQSPPPVSRPIRTPATIPALVRMARPWHARSRLRGLLPIVLRLRARSRRLPRGRRRRRATPNQGQTSRPCTRASPATAVSAAAGPAGARRRTARAGGAARARGRAAHPAAAAPRDGRAPSARGTRRSSPRTPAARPTTRPRSPTSASSTTAPPRCRCRSRTTRGCSRSRRATASRASRERAPGRPRAGPERYYPTERRSFVRIGPTDLREAEALVERLARARSHALRARLRPRDLRPRAGGAGGRTLARRAGLRPVASEEYRGQVPSRYRISPARSPRAAPTRSCSSAWRAAATIPMLARIDDAAPRRAAARRRAGCWRVRGLALPPGPARIEAVGPALPPGARRATRRCGSCSTRWTRAAATAAGVIAAGLRLRPPMAGEPLAVYRPGADGRFERAGTAP